MSSVHNPSTSSGKVRIEDGQDRISELPDALLIHILSFLPTKSVVDKSILSPRWRNLWASVPVLDFDDRSHSEYRDPIRPGTLVVPCRFMDFVNKVLLRHDLSSISKFRLYSVRRLDLYHLNVWIAQLVNRLIQEIDLNFQSYGCCVCLPQSFCTSKTLVVLRLGYRLRIQLPSSVWFPSLKILEISLLHPENNITQKLLSSCPILEELIVDAFLYETRNMVLNVAIPTLKRLTIKLMGDTDVEYHDSKIMLDTPSLENLSLHDNYLVYYSVKNMASLVKANVHIAHWLPDYETKELDIRLHAIMRGLATVKSLSLSHDVFVVLDQADDFNFPIFYNLIHMDMHIHMLCVWPLLPKLFKSMPNLERLELSIVYSTCGGVQYFNDKEFITAASQVMVPSCLLSRLKEIKIDAFHAWENEMNLVKYLLKNAKVLEKFTIDFHHCSDLDVEEKKKIEEELLSCTKTCRIVIVKFLGRPFSYA